MQARRVDGHRLTRGASGDPVTLRLLGEAFNMTDIGWATSTASQRLKEFDEYILWTIESGREAGWEHPTTILTWVAAKLLRGYTHPRKAGGWVTAVEKCAALLGRTVEVNRERLQGLVREERRERTQLPPEQRRQRGALAKRSEIPSELVRKWMKHCIDTEGCDGIQTAATIALSLQGGLRASDVEDVSKWGSAFEIRDERPYISLVRKKTAAHHDEQGFFLDTIAGTDAYKWLKLAAEARGHTLGDAHEPLLVNPRSRKPWTAREWRNVVNRLTREVPSREGDGESRREVISTHSFRYTAANLAKRQGLSTDTINMQLGWAKGSHTFSFSYERPSEKGDPESPVG
jgi:hypothetical protein